MSNYLIITPNLCNMGGAQLYVLRRSIYLKKKGYNVFIVVWFDNGYFPLKTQFEDTPIFVSPELAKPYVLVNKKKATAAINSIADFVGIDKDTIIESHTFTTIEWGEIIASFYKCKHLAYPLTEESVARYIWKPGKKILRDKLKHNELYGLSDASLEIMFGNPCSPNNYVNVGFDERELVDKSVPSIEYEKSENDFVISTVSRLDKTYIESLVDDVIKLANKYPQQSFILIVAGGSKTGNRQSYLVNKYKQENIHCSNLRVLFTGYITSLGRDLFLNSDVVVGTGLAAINSISQSRVTIVIDERNDRALGFFGTDTNNFGYGSLKHNFSIFSKLDEAYLLDSCKKEIIKKAGRQLYQSDFYTERCFEKLDVAISQIRNSAAKDYLKVGWGEYLFFHMADFAIDVILLVKKIIREVVAKRA